jgi:muramoyltetrapeptide carboxypeptidase
MVASNFSNEISSYTEENFWRIITSNKKPGRIELLSNSSLSRIKTGEISGKLIGGNLSVFTSLLGTNYLPELKNKILLLEEINEPPYKIDRMLNQLKLNNVFKKLNGIVLGDFSDCTEPNKNKKSLTLMEVWNDYFNSMKIPVVHSFPHGHIKDIVTLPIGSTIKINLKKNFVELTETGVR